MVKGLKTLFCAVERAGSKVIFTGLQANKQGILFKCSIIEFVLFKLFINQLEYFEIIAGKIALVIDVGVWLLAGYTGDIYICLWWELAKSFCGACFFNWKWYNNFYKNL